jgi:hypothetical protein
MGMNLKILALTINNYKKALTLENETLGKKRTGR